MKGFKSFAGPIERLLMEIVNSEDLHAKWLNTLSYLENCGARQIASCQHPTLVKEEVLKHAAEEFRHALHFKRQIQKISARKLDDYTSKNILGGRYSVHYLKALELKLSRYLIKEVGMEIHQMREAAYLLITYAIELRAEELYGIYHGILKMMKSKVTVKSILIEEVEHLNEMRDGLRIFPEAQTHTQKACEIESELCEQWIDKIQNLRCSFLAKEM